MKPLQKQWLTWAILTAVVLAISLFFGVNYPMPEQPPEPPDPIVELGANFTNPVDLEGTSTAAAPALTFQDDTDTGLFRSAANTLNIATGGTERVEIDSSALTVVPPLDADGGVDAVVGTENIGLPTIHSTSITYTAAAGGSGTVATIGDGEIWFVHKVFVHTTTSFDCTGDDAFLHIGDGNDADGFLALADASIQSDFTEATGFAAGWGGIENGSAGAYTTDDGGPFVYAPSGAAETIDWLLDETSGETITAGAATIYVLYTRIQ